MVNCEIEVQEETYEFFERMAREHGRSIEEEIEVMLCFMIQDSAYLNHLEHTHRHKFTEEWEDAENDE